MTKRDQRCRLFSRLNASDLGDSQNVALGVVGVVEEEREDRGTDVNGGYGGSGPLRGGFVRYVDHAGFTVGPDMAQLLLLRCCCCCVGSSSSSSSSSSSTSSSKMRVCCRFGGPIQKSGGIVGDGPGYAAT